MYKIRQDKSFIKDLQKHRLNDSELFNFTRFITLLCEGKSLPKEARDHALRGQWQGARELHIGSDKLIIYIIESDEIRLIRLGTHAQLFA